MSRGGVGWGWRGRDDTPAGVFAMAPKVLRNAKAERPDSSDAVKEF